jgi:ketosteroid isomerase-like protein
MNQAEAVRAAVLRLYSAIGSTDLEAVSKVFSTGPDVVAIGTDAHEWWGGHSAIVEALGRQFEGSAKRSIVPGELVAHAEGTLGWASDRRTRQMSNGKDITIRETFVLRLEDGEWKIVQFHASLATTDTATALQ